MTLVKYSLTYKAYLLRKIKCQAEVVFPVLREQGAPGKAVRVEDMDEGTEGQTIAPAGGEVCHWDLEV